VNTIKKRSARFGVGVLFGVFYVLGGLIASVGDAVAADAVPNPITIAFVSSGKTYDGTTTGFLMDSTWKVGVMKGNSKYKTYDNLHVAMNPGGDKEPGSGFETALGDTVVFSKGTDSVGITGLYSHGWVVVYAVMTSQGADPNVKYDDEGWGIGNRGVKYLFPEVGGITWTWNNANAGSDSLVVAVPRDSIASLKPTESDLENEDVEFRRFYYIKSTKVKIRTGGIDKVGLTEDNWMGYFTFTNSATVENPKTYTAAAQNLFTVAFKTGFSNPTTLGTTNVTPTAVYADKGDGSGSLLNAPKDVGKYWPVIKLGTTGRNFKFTGNEDTLLISKDTVEISKAPLSIGTLPGETNLTMPYSAKDSLPFTPANYSKSTGGTKIIVEDDLGGRLVINGFIAADINKSGNPAVDFKITKLIGRFGSTSVGSGKSFRIDTLEFNGGTVSGKNYELVASGKLVDVDNPLSLASVGTIEKGRLTVTEVQHGKVYDRTAGVAFGFTSSATSCAVGGNLTDANPEADTVTLTQTIGGKVVKVKLKGLKEAAAARPTTLGAFFISSFGGSYAKWVGESLSTWSDAGADSMNFFTGTIGGSVGENYTFASVASQPNVKVTGGIATKSVSITGIKAYDKVDDKTDSAVIDSRESGLIGVINPDEVRIEVGKANFTDKAVGLRQVNFTGFSLTGEQSKNYTLSGQPESVFARILPDSGVTLITIRGTDGKNGSKSGIANVSDSIFLLADIEPGNAKNWNVDWSYVDTSEIVRVVRSVKGQAARNDTAATPDTLVLAAKNMGNGTVIVRATSRDGSGTVSAPFLLSVSGQRGVPLNFTALTGINRDNERGQAVLSWNAPNGGSGTIVGYQVRREDGAWVLASSTSSHTLVDLPTSGQLAFQVKAIYSDGGEGPAAKVSAEIAARRAIASGEIVYNAPGTGLTYNRAKQDIGRATLTGGSGYVADGKDPLDTLYRYVLASEMSAAELQTADVSTFKKFGEAVKPEAAGTYRTAVIFRNSRYIGRRVTQFEIARKALTSNMITFPSQMPTFTYDGKVKTFPFTVVDGVAILEPDLEFTGATGNTDGAFHLNIEAGSNTAQIRIRGVGNYSDLVVNRNFSIGRKAITLDTSVCGVEDKIYDGTTNAKDSSLIVKFKDLADGDDLKIGADFTVVGARYTSVNAAAENNEVSADIRLVANGTKAKNYTLSSTPGFKRAGKILAKEPDTSDFSFEVPKDHLYNGVARGIGVVTVRSPKALVAGDSLKVWYAGPSGRTDSIPVLAGTYRVSVELTAAEAGKSNFTSKVVDLPDYVIGAPKPATIVSHTVTNTTVRAGNIVTLSVTAESPNEGTLSYQWYRIANGVDAPVAAGGRTASFNPGTDSVGSAFQYYVVVTNSKPGVQVPDSSAKTPAATITVLQAAVSLIGADVQIDGEYTYTGSAIQPERVTVTLNGRELSQPSEYTVSVTQNTNAGRALVTVRGVDAFKDSSSGSFTIARKTLVQSDLRYTTLTTYNGAPQRLVVDASAGRTGLGVVSVRYWTDSTTSTTTAPTNAGDYAVTATVAQGLNFSASPADTIFDLGTYSILPKDPVDSDFNFVIPTGHVFDGTAQGIGTVTMKKGDGFGELTVLYNGEEALPVEEGTYNVSVEVEGGNNYLYSIVPLGQYTIAPEEVSVASKDHVIPGGKDAQTVIAPVSVVAGEFTAGPNPVAKAAGKVGFFWQGKALSSGTLYVFDASGNVVTKVTVSDKGVNSVRREIGSWNLATAKGGAVAEGTYLVKGALVGKDGGKVKVSSILGVSK